MATRKVLVSVFIVAVCSVKVAEIVFQLETFPLTHTGMFAEYEPREKAPWTYTIEGFRQGQWRTLRPWVLRLEPDVVIAKLGSDFTEMPARCGALIDPLNRERDKWLRLTQVRLRALKRGRPGTGQVDERHTIECELDARARGTMSETLAGAWQRWWFTPRSLTDLGVARLCLACVILALGMRRYLIVGRAWGDQWEPLGMIAWLGIAKPDLALMEPLAWLTTTLAILVAAGLFTRVALFLLLPLFLFDEALLMSFGKTSHATIPILWALLFFALAPCDRRFALDALARQWRRRDPAAETSEFARWPIELFYVVLSGYYFSAGLTKMLTSGIRWVDGYTLQYHLLYKGEPFGLALAEYPWLCAIGSAAVIGWQLTFPLGLIRRLRPFYLLGGVGFHLSTGLLMDVWFWPVPALYLLFVPWSRVGRTLVRFTTRRECPA